MDDTPPAQPAHRHRSKPVRIARAHDRLLLSFAVGALTFLVLAYFLGFGALPAGLAGWIVGVVLYLASALAIMGRFDLARVRARAAIQDEGGVLILALAALATAASFAAIFAQLQALRASGAAISVHLTLAVVTILLSWTFIQVIFAFRYAHEYYAGDRDGPARGLIFPNDDKPDYWDFVYLALTIGMSFEVADVQITSKRIRRTATAHGFISFIFNMAILALFVNIVAGLLNS